MRALLTKALADLRRRRLQSAVVLVIVFLASGTATLALTLMAQNSSPYDRAFQTQHGAHLIVWFDATLVTRQQAAATGSLVGASAVGGPWSQSNITYGLGTAKQSTNLLARDDPGGPVSQLRVVAGRWASGPGEIVLTRSFADAYGLRVGDTVRDVALAARPRLRVVGEVVDIDEGTAELTSQTSWVTEDAFPRLAMATGLAYQVEYRFPGTPDAAELSRAIDRLKASLPPTAVTGSLTYLTVRTVFGITNAILTNVLLAFSVFALGASAAIVVNLIAGIVLAGYREIGIMKAVGYTPAQVVAVLDLEMLAPAAAGALLGVAGGTLLSQPLLEQSAHALGLPPEVSYSPVLDLAALAAILALVAVAATLPALRAGRLHPVRAIAVGAAPAASGGLWLRRVLGGRAPRPLAFGLGEAFARPLRGTLTVLAVLLGVATVTFAVGSHASLDRSLASFTHAGRAQVQVTRQPAYPDESVTATLDAQPETARVVGIDGTTVTVSGLADPVTTFGYRGDSSSLGFFIIAGRWFQGPNEAVAPRALLRDAHLAIGDTFLASSAGRSVRVRIVGETYDIRNLGHTLHVDWSTYEQLQPDPAPTTYFVTLGPGADAAAYARRVAATEPDFLDVQLTNAQTFTPVQIIDAVTLTLAVVLALIAAAGVFNTVLLTTREQARDTAILKALGMTPAQVLTMVLASAGALAGLGGLLGAPAGVAVYHVLTALLQDATGNDVPPQTLDVFTPLQLVAVPVAGLVVAMAAAALPGQWSARTSVVQVLHAE